MLKLGNTRHLLMQLKVSSGCEIVTVAIRRLPTDLKMIIQTFK
jgi:thiazole synthase ThiGH ThiG subunit